MLRFNLEHEYTKIAFSDHCAPVPHIQSTADRKEMFPDTYKNIFLSVCLLRKTNTKKKKQKEAKNNKFNQRIPNILWPDGWHDYFGNNIEGISFVFFVCWLPSLHLLSWPVSRTSRVWFEQINNSFGYGCSKISIGLVQKKLIHSWTSSHSIGGSLWSFLLLLVNNCYS